MKKHGFTLAEILITMTIVGVVTTLTIPSLLSSYKKQTWEASLSNAVNAFSNASSMMIMKDGSDGMYDTNAWLAIENNESGDPILEHLGETLSISKSGNGNSFYSGISIKQLSGTTFTGTFGDYKYYTTNSNITYFFRPITLGSNDMHATLDMVAGDLIIDVNGKSAPNTIGKDIFGFLLNNDGRLIPYGATEDLNLTSAVKNSSLNNTARVTEKWTEKCTDSSSTGFACTGKVVKENYKINYL